ncbi:MAG: hypothetical protein ACK4KV_19195 [Rhodocyclaceae bacterium]
MRAPADVPELLSLLAVELDSTLARLLPAMSEGAREQLAMDLMHCCRKTIGGHRLPTARHKPAAQLLADPAYGRLHDAWRPMLTQQSGMPDPWVSVALLHLLDTLRTTARGEYIPRSTRATSPHMIEEMYRRHRGDFRETGLEFGISGERVRQLIGPLIAADRASRQARLFDD